MLTFLIRQQEYNCFVIMFPHLLFFWSLPNCSSEWLHEFTLCPVGQRCPHCSASSSLLDIVRFPNFCSSSGCALMFFVVLDSWPWWTFAQDMWTNLGRNVAIFKKILWEFIWTKLTTYAREQDLSCAQKLCYWIFLFTNMLCLGHLK